MAGTSSINQTTDHSPSFAVTRSHLSDDRAIAVTDGAHLEEEKSSGPLNLLTN